VIALAFPTEEAGRCATPSSFTTALLLTVLFPIGSKIDDATIASSGISLHEAIRTPSFIVALQVAYFEKGSGWVTIAPIREG
jgi:hypothetical protein